MIIIKIFQGKILLEKKEFSSNITGDNKSQKWLREMRSKYKREPKLKKTEQQQLFYRRREEPMFRVEIRHNPPTRIPEPAKARETVAFTATKKETITADIEDDLPF